MPWETLPQSVLVTMGGILGLLLVATVAVLILQRLRPQGDVTELRQRVRTWWVMVVLFCTSLALTRTISLVFFGLISYLALKEYLSLIPTRRADRRVLFWAYLAVPVQYLWVGYEWYGMFLIFIPVYLFLFLPFRMMTIGETAGFLTAAGTLHWGVMTTVFSISHMAYLLVLPPAGPGAVGGAGLVLFLVVLTQLNDVLQYVWGKSLGGRKVVPKVSPGKTWAGFLGGAGSTAVLAVVLAPYLTPLGPQPISWELPPLLLPLAERWQGLAAGLIIGVGGFVGDVTISALKRDLGVKDSGSLLPGHGGILDRIDSLTYTAPLFFHFIYYLHY